MEYTIPLAKQSCNWALNSNSRSHETNIKINKEIASLFIDNVDDFEQKKIEVKFLIHKDDFVKALCGIFARMPLARSKDGKIIFFNLENFNAHLKSINDFFGNKNVKEKTAELCKPANHSFCLNFGSKDPLPIREYCLEAHTELLFRKSDSAISLRIEMKKDSEVFFEESSNPHEKKQIIFYGAPGTGKSHEVMSITGELDGKTHENVFRTTFHPDTDYSSFVGCYKPVPKGAIQPIKSLKELKYDYHIIKETQDCNFAAKLGALYWNSFNLIDKEEILTFLDSPTDYEKLKEACEVGKFLSKNKQEVISYDFVPQVFTKAYIYAYKNPTIKTYLVIEEINRGNCAQIFGDLFQLLDRKGDGTSDYPIQVDTDLQRYLEKELGKNRGIIDGKLSLPSNLYILCTMNTSDQSLFPIDSAFKRRWEMKYVPIEQPQLGERGNPRKWKISANGHWCYWWEFLKAINEIIAETTHSEDKQLGYFFARPDEGEFISAESFVSKVIFYLWNDVFKDEDNNIFKYKKLEDYWDVPGLNVKKNDLFFRNFIISMDEVNEKLVQWFINNILFDQKVPLLDDIKQEPNNQNIIAYMRPISDESSELEVTSESSQIEEGVDVDNKEIDEEEVKNHNSEIEKESSEI